MKNLNLKKPLLFVLCLLPVALIGGWFVAQYSFSLIDESTLEEAVRQIGSKDMLMAIAAVQAVLYAAICGFFGSILAEKTGLMRPFRLFKSETVRVVLISIVCGAVFSLDVWTFGKWIPEVGEYYSAA